ncbi:energy transducer TonB [Sphingomonas ginkgonis]|uniref:Energy transducer TonB n=1 Tax=Sphingomonas ginkgonis TaxID=2315330 RepID=A0A3R9YKF1_9SPHN|nr:energy transducer TonB [Sphingomonas ginkgonis]RST29792.1 energy transducer TonB [Sphingomonas ginkgonis]
MLDYASARRPAHQRHPVALGLIIAGHAAALFAVITAKMEVGTPWHPVITRITEVPLPPDSPPLPPPPKADPRPTPHPQSISSIDRPVEKVVLPLPGGPVTVPGPTAGPDPFPIGPVVQPPPPLPPPLPKTDPVRRDAVLATSADELRPPYPEAMRRLEKEATLQLRLSIDERGRVTAVEPIGPAEPAFLDSARRQILSHWRYRPATEDGRPVATSLVIRLRFQLDEG